MRILKMLLRLACLPALIAVLLVHIATAVVIGLSSIVTNLLGTFFIAGACVEWIAHAPPMMAWQAAGIGVFLLLAPHIAGWLNTKAAEISGCVFGFIMA